MINGHWWEEARQHWQHVLAALPVIKQALPMQEWIRIAVIAIVTAVVTSQITLARIEERISAGQQLRAEGIARRDLQITKLEQRDADLSAKIDLLLQKVSAIEARIK